MKQANNLAQKVREYAKVYEPKDFIPVYGCFRAFWQLSGRYMDYYHKMGRTSQTRKCKTCCVGGI